MRNAIGTVAAAVALLLLVASTTAHADDAKKKARFCAALGTFENDVAALQSLGPGSTIGQLHAAADRVDAAAYKVQKTAGKIKSPTAKGFTQSVRQLNVDSKQIPRTLTIQQAQSRIAGDVQNVKRSARQLASESGCPEAARRTSR